MKNIAIIILSLIPTILFGIRNDTIEQKFWLSNKIKRTLVKDLNNKILEKNEFSRKGHKIFTEYSTKNDTFFHVEYYPSGNPKSIGRIFDNKKEGEFKFYTDQNDFRTALNGVSNFKNNKLHGQTTFFKINSFLQYDTTEIWNFKNGQQFGVYFLNYENMITLIYFYDDRQIFKLFYYKKKSSIIYKVYQKKIRKYNLDINLIVKEFGNYLTSIPPNLIVK